MRWVLVLAACAGCITPDTPHCGPKVCPADKVCDANRVECVLPAQVTVCTGQTDGTPCSFPDEDDGVCDHQVCHASVCGDGLIGAHEVCDDANSVDGDGCSAQCESDEKCGNGIVDVAVGESCDDDNLLSGDGCSSGCGAEVASWHQVDLDTYPGEYGAQAAYDPVRGVVVVFGGDSPTGMQVPETWQYDGAQWERMLHGQLPPPRDGHVLAYDARRRAIVLFGGQSGMAAQSTRMNDAWTFDGAWHPLAATNPPSPRAGAAGAYDAQTHSLIVFGGETAAGVSAETWELSGGAWTLRASAGPAARRDHLMTYDAARGRVVLVGGKDGSGAQLDDTWEWDGTAWARVTTAVTPPNARGAIAYDADLQLVIVTGGLDTPIKATWQYDGVGWSARTELSPSERRRPAMAYDAALHSIVLRGGTERPAGMGGQPEADTWTFAGAWIEDTAAAPHAPPQRTFGGFAFDPLRERMILTGGFEPPGSHRGDTWTYDGAQWVLRADDPALALCGPGQCTTQMAWDSAHQRMLLVRPGIGQLDTWTYDGTWTKLATTGAPPGRDVFAMGFDAKRGALVVFGGEMGMTPLADTWELVDTTWHRVDTPMTPPARGEGAMVFDTVRGKLLMFGGTAGTAHFGDTWTYDGHTWAQLATPHAPAPRGGAGLVFHVARGRAILFGGDAMMGPTNDTWELGPTDWTQLSVFEGPSPRRSPMTAYDQNRKLIVLHGGDPQNDTWELQYRSTEPIEVCTTPADEDADGLTDCGDPDCDGSLCLGADHVCVSNACACVASSETRCSDRTDDDCDGLVDCADPDCACAHVSSEIACGDGLDDDQDGLVDCRDPDCFLDPCIEVQP